jgi:hypothetical protein
MHIPDSYSRTELLFVDEPRPLPTSPVACKPDDQPALDNRSGKAHTGTLWLQRLQLDQLYIRATLATLTQSPVAAETTAGSTIQQHHVGQPHMIFFTSHSHTR